MPENNQDPFPCMLHRMLCEIDGVGELPLVISWSPDGKSFSIHDTHRFSKTLMPHYFENQTRYKSFQRQLNLYKFTRQKPGEYSHPLFVRDNPSLCRLLKRDTQTTRRRSRASSNTARSTGVMDRVETHVPIQILSTVESLDSTPSHFGAPWKEISNHKKESLRQSFADLRDLLGSMSPETSQLLDQKMGQGLGPVGDIDAILMPDGPSLLEIGMADGPFVPDIGSSGCLFF